MKRMSAFQCRWMLASAIIVVIMMGASTASSQTANMKWCTTWLSKYEDAGKGEDYFAYTGTYYRQAQYTYARVVKTGVGTIIWEGELDASGCSPYMQVESNTPYQFKQGTKAQRSTRRIYVNPEGGDWGLSWIWYNTYYTTPTLTQGANYTQIINLNSHTPWTNLMPVMGRILSNYDYYQYPASTITIVRVDSDHCTGPGYLSNTSWVCLPGEGARGWDDTTAWKYIIGHEMGHRLASANNGVIGSGDYDHSGTNGYCNCNLIDDYGDTDHCLQSREPIAAAQGEGFAHFFSTMLFNDRIENNGIYVYPKEAMTNDGEGWSFSTPPTGWPAYNSTPETYSDRWMETYCDPGDLPRGVELDWLRFFFELWTTGTYRYSVDEISAVWGEAYPYRGWNDVRDAAIALYSTDKEDLFIDKGELAGVDHYAP